MPRDDMTNQKLFGLISAETACVVAGAIVAGSIAWGALANDVESNKATVEKVQSKQEEIGRDIGEIREDISGIKSTQAMQVRQMERILNALEKQGRGQ